MVLKNIVGQFFGGWKVVKFIGMQKENSLWECECQSCNKTHVFNLTKLWIYKKQNIQGCRKCYAKRALDKSKNAFIGKQFNDWTVLDYDADSRKPGEFWICKCKCGYIASISRSAFKINGTGSKRCKKCFYASKTKHELNFVLNHIKGGAVKRSGGRGRTLKVKITCDDLQKQLEKQNYKCALSGEPLLFGQTSNRMDEHYTNASVDRIDSSKDYTIDNIQWVTKQINYGKLDYSSEEFIQMCNRVAKTHPR